MFWIAQLIAGTFGLDISKVQRWCYIAAVVLIFILVAVVAVSFRSCERSHKLKVEQKQLEKLNKADEKQRVEELQTVITDNADVVKTVDQRNTIANTDETQRNVEIYSKIQEADRKIVEAKAQGRDVTGPELDCMLTGVCQK